MIKEELLVTLDVVFICRTMLPISWNPAGRESRS